MAPFKLFLLILFLSCQNPLVASQYPGLKIRVTREGLDYANSVASQILTNGICSAQIPNVRGDGFEAWNIRLTHFDSAQFSYGLHPPSSFSWSMNGAKIAVLMQAKVCKWIFCVYLDQVDINAHGVDMRLEASVHRHSSGRLMLTVPYSGCHASIDSLDLHISGGLIEWILNLFRNCIATSYKPTITGMICDKATYVVRDWANRLLTTFPTETIMAERFILDYGLAEDPVVSQGHIEAGLTGNVSSLQYPSIVSPYPPAALAEDVQDRKMLYGWVSEKVFNDFLYLVHQTNLSRTILNQHTPGIGDFLKFRCDADDPTCIGRWIPDLPTIYNQSEAAEVDLRTSEAPTLAIRNGTAIAEGAGKLELYAPLPAKKAIAKADTLIQAELKLRIENGSLVGDVTIAVLTANLTYSSHPRIGQKFFDFFANAAKKALQKEIDKLTMKKGFPIPVAAGIRLNDSRIQLTEQTVQVGTDVIYDG